MNVLPFLWQSLILFILISHVWTGLKLGWVTIWKLEIIAPVFDPCFLILFVVVLKTDIRSRATKENNFFPNNLSFRSIVSSTGAYSSSNTRARREN